MQLNELNAREKEALIGLLAWMLRADGEEDAGEVEELFALEEEMGVDDLAVAVAAVDVSDTEALLDAAEANVRPAAYPLFHTVLHDLSVADGSRHAAETGILDALESRWTFTQ